MGRLPDGIEWYTHICDAQDYLGMKEGVRSPAPRGSSHV